MTDTVLSDRERYVIRHALGFGEVNRANVAYRNYFACDDSGADFETWTRLVERGLAVRWASPMLDGGYYFAASGVAARAAKKPREGFDREITMSLESIDLAIAQKAAGNAQQNGGNQ
jgi:hypothetical protein